MDQREQIDSLGCGPDLVLLRTEVEDHQSVRLQVVMPAVLFTGCMSQQGGIGIAVFQCEHCEPLIGVLEGEPATAEMDQKCVAKSLAKLQCFPLMGFGCIADSKEMRTPRIVQ